MVAWSSRQNYLNLKLTVIGYKLVHILGINVLKNKIILWFVEKIIVWKCAQSLSARYFFIYNKKRKIVWFVHDLWIKPFCDLWENLFWENMPNFWQLGTYSFTKKILWFVHNPGSNHFVIYGKVYFEKICPIFVSSALFHLQKKSFGSSISSESTS